MEIKGKIIVQWHPIEKNETTPLYDNEMIVVYSTHERFPEHTRFNFGFLQIANNDGYIVEVLP